MNHKTKQNKMKDEKISKGNIIIISFAVLVIIAVLIFAVLYKTSKPVISNNGIRIEGFEGEKTMQTLASSTECVLPTNKNYDEFAKCLTQKGAVMYGAEWCPHCKDQKAAFGDSFKYINYVECPDNTQLCIDKGIQGYPTWIISSSSTINSTTTKNN